MENELLLNSALSIICYELAKGDVNVQQILFSSYIVLAQRWMATEVERRHLEQCFSIE